MKKLLVLGTLLALGACHAEYNIVLLPTTKEDPRDPCAFDVQENFPADAEYVEIGRMEVEFSPAHELADFKEAVKNDVCHVGADIVVVEKKDGRINEAILYRKR